MAKESMAKQEAKETPAMEAKYHSKSFLKKAAAKKGPRKSAGK